MIEKIVEEIFTRYGDWAMGAHGPEQGGPDVLSVFEEHQPTACFITIYKGLICDGEGVRDRTLSKLGYLSLRFHRSGGKCQKGDLCQ